MSTQEIADRLVALCRIGQYDEAYKELFADDAVSIEPEFTQQPPVKGLDNLLAKSAQFATMFKELHDSSVSAPIVAGNCFACTMMIDTTNHEDVRSKMEEICLYHVKDGKIISEQFFF
ncbi:MAG: nuclear transport factor 2 family protein [Saprospiraceae bacterium]|nr:nuclear transport factor 2 family protein [Lewinella sp.]